MLELMVCEFKILKLHFIKYFLSGANFIFFLTCDLKIGLSILFILVINSLF